MFSRVRLMMTIALIIMQQYLRKANILQADITKELGIHLHTSTMSVTCQKFSKDSVIEKVLVNTLV